MTGTVPTRITEILSADEIRSFVQPSDAQGALSVATTWAIIVLAFALVAYWPTPLSIAVSLILLGGRHLALAILMHECSHYSLFRTRMLNDFAGKWLCAAPTWQDVHRYRVHHLAHHAHTGTARDPDMSLVDPFPARWPSLARKFARDMLGLTALRRIAGLLLMDFGYLNYSASPTVTRIDQTGRTVADALRTGVRHLTPVVVTNALLFGLLAMTGHPALYWLWIASYMTTFSLFLRIRSIAEHACTSATANQFLNTRTTAANPLARLTVAPHHVNYHLEHHLLMTAPHYRLPTLHRRLKELGVYAFSPFEPGYRHVLRLAATPASVDAATA